MFRFIEPRATGKSTRLAQLANDNNGIFVCKDPEVARDLFDLSNVTVMSYRAFAVDSTPLNAPVFIDELEQFIKYIYNNRIIGYTIGTEDNDWYKYLVGELNI